MSDKEVEYKVTPQFLVLDKAFKGVGGRLSATKDLDKSSSIQAYADMVAGDPKGADAFVKPQKIGFEYRRHLPKAARFQLLLVLTAAASKVKPKAQ